ncbi:unnamed protein product [Lepeophtheirus salmonis]|uniref:(salmon louse) hypothetical protein n=1 Tax=Lepeophtheirus salmonis TaxID=72036 RepID=A0A7R8CS86_LEPSM|nr:unnamed protein product [Lepeophtheirus salmonis]CAF2877169.1 unnamed protein product [Lepeophtheirus salmonis]
MFGDKPSQDLSQSVVRFIAEKYANEHPEATIILNEDTFVDGIATSVESDEVDCKIIMVVDRILHCGGFKIKISYYSEIRSGETRMVVPGLGHSWDVESDYIRLGVRECFSVIKRFCQIVLEYGIP